MKNRSIGVFAAAVILVFMMTACGEKGRDIPDDSIAAEAEDSSSDEIAEQGEENMGESAKLLYQGHASLRITTPEGKVIYVDPFAGEGYDVPADLILLTHGHYDHTRTDLITSKKDDCKTISWVEALEGGKHRCSRKNNRKARRGACA